VPCRGQKSVKSRMAYEEEVYRGVVLKGELHDIKGDGSTESGGSFRSREKQAIFPIPLGNKKNWSCKRR